MSAFTFDTLKFANRLKNAGISPVHAEAEAAALSEVFETNLSELATKEDLRHEIKELELRMTIKLGSIVIAALGALTVIFKFL